MAVYVADHVGFARLMKSDEIAVVIRRKAEVIAALMRVSAPHVTGAYAANFSVESGLDVARGERGVSFIINDSDYATALEVGSWNIRNPPQPMTRVLRGIGVI